MNKADIKKVIKAKPSEEQIIETTLSIVEQDESTYIDLLLDKRPKIGRAVQLFLTGTSRVEIGSMLGVQASTVSRWLNDPNIKKYMREFQLEEGRIIKARMHASSASALDKMVKLLDSPIDGVALQAAKDLLDRAGHKPKQEVKKEVVIKTFEEQLLDVIGGDLIDVDFEEVIDE